MRRFRTLTVSGVLVAYAVIALVAPAGAADTKGTLAIVNGIPGRTVDVCLNGKEIKRGLRYGKAVLKDVVSIGHKDLKFYARDPRRCQGGILAQKAFNLVAGDDLTLVATKKPPKVVTFDNAGLGEIPPNPNLPSQFPRYAFRHAADIAANFSTRTWGGPTDDPVDPSGTFSKGQQKAGILVSTNAIRIQASVGGPVLIVSAITEPSVLDRHEWILVGTKPANARFVFFARTASVQS